MEELGVVAQGHLAAAVHLVGAHSKVCSRHRVARTRLVTRIEGISRGLRATRPVRSRLVVVNDEAIDLTLEFADRAK
jgi:hypothetical protein